MAILINQQRQAQQARNRTQFCYLCGNSLPLKRAARKREVSREHIIPQKLFAESNAPESDRWLVVLDVHSSCDRKAKQKFDDYYQRLQRLSVGRADGGGLSPKKDGFPAELDLTSGPDSIPILKGIHWLMDCVRNWIRGLHTILYVEYLSRSTRFLTIPPVPAFGSGPEGMPLQEVEETSRMTREVLKRSEKLDLLDRIVAWGGHLEYSCVWWLRKDQQGVARWVCVWGLSFPGVFEWSAKTPTITGYRPWHGQYVTPAPPAGASVLTLDEFNTVAENAQAVGVGVGNAHTTKL